MLVVEVSLKATARQECADNCRNREQHESHVIRAHRFLGREEGTGSFVTCTELRKRNLQQTFFLNQSVSLLLQLKQEPTITRRKIDKTESFIVFV